MKGFNLLDRQFVVAADLDLRAEFAQVLNEVISEGVVVVQDEHHNKIKCTAWTGFSIGRLRLQQPGASAKLRLGFDTMVLHFLIQGRVQGVGFRWFVQREASELDLRGWVRNTEEGEVEVVAAGDETELAQLRSILRRGPRCSRVDRVIEHLLAESEGAGLNSFRIEGAW